MSAIPKPEPLAKVRKAKRAALVAAERSAKEACRVRDGYRCRLPFCRSGWQIEVAHLEHKGMGGDKRLERTQQRKMVTLCRKHHQQLDAKLFKIEPTTDAGTNGPCRWTDDDGGRGCL